MGIGIRSVTLQKIILQLLITYVRLAACSAKNGNVSAMFIFGDSSLDVGNNCYLNTYAKPFYPHGIDFGTANMSGRFTNGRTVGDIIGQKLGFKKFTPPFLKPTTVGDVILKGVNFASSTAGILDDIGSQFGDRIKMGEQIDDFQKTRRDVIARLGKEAARQLIRKALFLVAIGGNDVMSLQGMNDSDPSFQEAFFENLIATLRPHLVSLYSLDARKVIVANGGKIGSLPTQRERFPFIDGCVPFMNHFAQSYNAKFERMIEELNDDLVGAKFIVADVYAGLEDILDNHVNYGFEDADNACCNAGGRRGALLECNLLSTVCADRKRYVFWDSYHMTDAANQILARHLMEGGSKYARPMNIGQLANS